MKAWEDEVTSSWLPFALTLSTNWSLRAAFSHLQAKGIQLESRMVNLESPGTITPHWTKPMELQNQGNPQPANSSTPLPPQDWEFRILHLKIKWEQFLAINKETYLQGRKIAGGLRIDGRKP